MKKITNIVTSPTKYTEDLEWSGVISYKIRLLQNSDWIIQPGSGVLKQHKWLQWREDIRKCNRESFQTPEQLLIKLEQLDSEIPDLVRFSSVDTNNIEHYKDNVVKLVKYYYSKKLDIDLTSYVSNILLIEERYKEVEQYQRNKNISDCYLLKNYMEITGKSVETAVQYFIDQKEMYYLLLLRNQKELETKLKQIDDTNDVVFLKKTYEDYNIWISTLTLTPVQI